MVFCWLWQDIIHGNLSLVYGHSCVSHIPKKNTILEWTNWDRRPYCVNAKNTQLYLVVINSKMQSLRWLGLFLILLEREVLWWHTHTHTQALCSPLGIISQRSISRQLRPGEIYQYLWPDNRLSHFDSCTVREPILHLYSSGWPSSAPVWPTPLITLKLDPNIGDNTRGKHSTVIETDEGVVGFSRAVWGEGGGVRTFSLTIHPRWCLHTTSPRHSYICMCCQDQ